MSNSGGIVEIGSLVDKAWSNLSNIQKGDWGEHIVEACLLCLGLEREKDFRRYPPSDKQTGIYHPEFTNKEFAIEVKNLSLTTAVGPGWIKDNVLNRFSPHYPGKILIIFGGTVYQTTIGLLKQKGVYFIHHSQPVSKRNFRATTWWLKSELLKKYVIRKEVAACNTRKLRPIRQRLRVIGKKGKPFLELSYDMEGEKFRLTSFDRTSMQPTTWSIHWREIRDLLREKKVSLFDWKKMDEQTMKFFEILKSLF